MHFVPLHRGQREWLLLFMLSWLGIVKHILIVHMCWVILGAAARTAYAVTWHERMGCPPPLQMIRL